MSRFCKELGINLLLWAYFQSVFTLLLHDIAPTFSVRIADYNNFILVFITAGCCFQAACEDLESNLIRWLNPKYVNLLKKLWLLLSWMAIGFRCVDFVPPDLSWPMDCITAVHTLRAISHLINFLFGLLMEEPVMTIILFTFVTVSMTHLAQFALEERSNYGWSNISVLWSFEI